MTAARVRHIAGYTAAVLVLLLPIASCASPPQPEEAPPVGTAPEPPAPPQPPPPQQPEEEPRPQAPLAGPRWYLDSLYGSSRMAAPPGGTVWIEFVPDGEAPLMRASNGIDDLRASYRHGPGERLTISNVTVEPAGTGDRRFSAYRQQLEDNIGLVQGYYITGSTWEESRLVLYGGVGLEEIVLAEFSIRD